MAKVQALSIVKVATVGNGVKEVCFEGTKMSLTEAIEQAGFSLDENRVRVNRVELASEAVKSQRVKDGDVVFLMPNLVGG